MANTEPGNYMEKRNTDWHDQALELLESGESYTAVGAVVNRDPDTVSKHFPGYGRYGEKFSWKPKAKQMLEDGASYREVGRTLGIWHTSVGKAFPGYGLTKQEAVEVRRANAILDSL